MILFAWLMLGISFSNSSPLLLQTPLRTESEIRFGYGMSFEYHGQMVHGLNRYNLLIGLVIPDLRIPKHYTPAENLFHGQFCESNNNENSKIWYTTCTNVWPAVQTANRKVHNLRFEINQVYEEEFPAIIPNFKLQAVKEPSASQNNKSPTLSRKKRFLTEIIDLGIQAFSAISTHRKQSKLQKSMKHLKYQQDVLDNKIEALEDDMISITKETFEELDYLRKELELT